MNHKIINAWLLLGVILISAGSCFFIPDSFQLQGGSCYQGITVSVIRFLLAVCSLLLGISLISLYFSWPSNAKSPAKVFSITAFLIWFSFSLFFLTDHFAYFLPFSILNGGIIRWSFRTEHKNPKPLSEQKNELKKHIHE